MMRSFWMGSFAYCSQENLWKCCIIPDFLTYTLPKNKGNFQTCWRHPVSWNFSDDLYSMSYDCARMVKNFGMGLLANWYQEHCNYDIWPKFHCPTVLPKRKEISEKQIVPTILFAQELTVGHCWVFLVKSIYGGEMQMYHIGILTCAIFRSSSPLCIWTTMSVLITWCRQLISHITGIISSGVTCRIIWRIICDRSIWYLREETAVLLWKTIKVSSQGC